MRYGIVIKNTPIGILSFVEENGFLVEGHFRTFTKEDHVTEKDTPLLVKTKTEIKEYFSGKRTDFDLPFHLKGTPFQLSVWNALCTIPYGKTASYKDIAVKVGNPKSCRAIGMANHRNPLPIIVPCHRVINADGSLGGYGGGLDKKITLLKTEKGL